MIDLLRTLGGFALILASAGALKLVPALSPRPGGYRPTGPGAPPPDTGRFGPSSVHPPRRT